MKLKISLLALLCPIFWASGQQTYTNKINALQIGEELPSISLSVISGMDSNSHELKIPEKEHELLLLDFWSTTCGGCIKSLPELTRLQNQFGGRLRIVLTAYDKKERIVDFFHNRHDTAGKNLPVVYQDTLLKQLFVHQYIPHIAWIYKGVFIGATGAEMVNEHKIKAVLQGRGLETTIKKDIVGFDFNQPLFPLATNTGPGQVTPLWTSVFSGYIPGLPLKAGSSNDNLNRSRRFYLVNHPVLHLYAIALSSPLPLLANRRLLPADGDYVYNKAKGYYRDWASGHCFSYELTCPDTVNEALANRQLKNDLDRFLGLKGAIVNKYVRCLVLKNAGPMKMISEHYTAGSDSHYVNTTDLVYLMNRQQGLPPVINNAGNRRLLLPDLSRLALDPDGWRALLAGSGLVLEEQQKLMPMFVLRSDR